MYNVSITNDYIYPLVIDGDRGTAVPPNGGTAQVKDWGRHLLNEPGMGDVNSLDLGDKKLSDYTRPKMPWTEATWAGLIRYRGLDAYFRYEGQGQVDVVVDEYGSLKFHFPQGGMVIELGDLSVT